MRSRWSLLLSVLFLAACAGEPEPVATTEPLPDEPVEVVNPFADPARRAMRIELGLDAYRRVKGAWTGSIRNAFTTDDASSTFTAYFEADTLRLIEEDMDLGEVGDGTSVYYFEDGAVFYAVQDERRVRFDRAEGARYDTVRLRAAFDLSGSVLASEQTVDGIEELLPVVQTEGVRRHAAALRDKALEAARLAL